MCISLITASFALAVRMGGDLLATYQHQVADIDASVIAADKELARLAERHNDAGKTLAHAKGRAHPDPSEVEVRSPCHPALVPRPC